MNEIGNWVALSGVAINLVALVVTAVWVVSRIGNATDLLANEIKHLASAVTKLESLATHLDSRTDDHETRLRLLEGK